MYKNKGFPGVFTVTLSGQNSTSSHLQKSTEIRALILLHKNEETSESHTFLERFLSAIPFTNEHAEVSVLFTDSPPHWSIIRDAYPNCVFILLIGFSYANIGLQFGKATGQLLQFRSTHFMEVPQLKEWKDDKKVKLHIWHQLKTLEKLH